MASARYEKLYKLAIEERDHALSEISIRLFNWAGLDPETGLTKGATKRKKHECIWLSEKDTEPLQKFIREFNKSLSRKDQGDLGIRGWECGICQMFDFTKSSVCKTFPYLFSAYMYNFPSNSNKFVHHYIEKNGISKEKFFSGIEKEVDINGEELGTSVGIGNLLRSKVPNSKKMCEQLIQFVDCFKFPKVIAIKLLTPFPNLFSEQPTYFLPVEHAEEFKRNCELHPIMVRNELAVAALPYEKKMRKKEEEEEEKWKYFLKVEYPPSGYGLYEKWGFYDLFCNLYLITSALAEKWPDHFAEKPDPVLCWILLISAFNDSKHLKMMEFDLESLSKDELKKATDEMIRDLYKALKEIECFCGTPEDSNQEELEPYSIEAAERAEKLIAKVCKDPQLYWDIFGNDYLSR